MYKVSSFYIFFRFTMVNTKVTPKKPKEICPVCFKEVEGKDAWTAHVIKCAGSMLVCEKCRVSFKKKEYMAKHMRLKHAEIDLSKESEKDIPGPSSSPTNDTDSESDWDEDPEVRLEETPRDEGPQTETNDLLAGRIYRKRTMPSPVQAPRKFICRTEVHPVPGGVTVETQTDTVVSGMADKSTQTAGYRKRVKEVTITKYHENGRSVENIVEREEFYNM